MSIDVTVIEDSIFCSNYSLKVTKKHISLSLPKGRIILIQQRQFNFNQL